ncbi:alpha/beta hydrolase [Paenibacillus chitinolyticus]|uniref:Alpha/beta hydrolase n=1 Tax=Paenibacillus chitinolyticus TaxID=79263 RepID=A0A410X1A0_9BACL|nr:alpha/beta hydrolase [Paenibacillus chitinolyticus]MCY9592477.1 alpha/beta hydrolase [Paenibacillus chitinolyticus]MCY9594920.1 alpha/beta hydrolase [Paenibacillus chitinolyticus]QAV20395.1 alpha/beta hydrolase [Paenibacillus chitinolyticus]
MSKTLLIGLCILAVLAVALTAAAFYMFGLGIRRSSKEFLQNSPDLAHHIEEIAVDPSPASADNWLARQTLEQVSIQSADGLRLNGWYLEAERPSDVTALLAHGYSGQGRDMASFAQIHHELGYNVLMPDNRGHGQSEGEYIGFGWTDRLDYVNWIRYILQRSGENARILLHGVSMGGATVLMASGERLPDQVKGIIADCSYTSVKDILSYQLKRMFKLPAFPLIPLTSLICKLKAGYFFGEASALRQVKRTEKPILFIHGEADTFVPFFMVHGLYKAAPAGKDLFMVPRAGHGLAFMTDKDGYRSRVTDFAKQCLEEKQKVLQARSEA